MLGHRKFTVMILQEEEAGKHNRDLNTVLTSGRNIQSNYRAGGGYEDGRNMLSTQQKMESRNSNTNKSTGLTSEGGLSNYQGTEVSDSDSDSILTQEFRHNTYTNIRQKEVS